MTTEFYKIGSGCDADVLERAGELIRSGELVAFPTETVYGLGANAYLAESARKVYAAKGRPSDNPLIVHVNDSADAALFAETNETYKKLAKQFMPGPLTVILPKKDVIPDEVTGGLRTVAVRCPSNPIARELIRRSGVPIAAPSANLSGKPSPTCAEHVMQDMDGRIAMVIDGGECEIGLESTVIAVSGNSANVLRPGAVTPDMLRSAGIAVTVDEAVTDPAKAGSAPQSPGMKYKHYAPKAELYLVEGGTAELIAAARSGGSLPSATAVMCSDDDTAKFPGFIVLDTGKSDEEYAHRLFSLLRRADELGAERIYASLPRADGDTLAIYNRIIRSSAGKIIRKTTNTEKEVL